MKSNAKHANLLSCYKTYRIMNVKINLKNKNRNMIFLKIGYYNSKNKSINKEDK